MVTWGDGKRWQPGPPQGMVGPLNGEYNELVACTDDLRSLNKPYGWSGAGADAAAETGNRVIDGLEETSAEVAALRRAAGDVGDAITGVQHGVAEAEEVARVHHFTIGEDGAIIDNGPPPDTPEDQKEAVEAERKVVAAELGDRVKEVLRQAEDIDNDFCAVLDRIIAGQTIDVSGNDNQTTSLAAAGDAGFAQGSLSILSPPAVDATPAQNAAWWASLSRNQQLKLIADLPEIVGNRDGVKAADRSQANLNSIDRERANITGDLQKVRAQQAGSGDNFFTTLLGLGVTPEINRLEERLKALDAITGMMHKPDGSVNTDRQLMSLDLTGDHPKAAIANGDVDNAQHVAVFTPGMNSNVYGNMNGYVKAAKASERALNVCSRATVNQRTSPP